MSFYFFSHSLLVSGDSGHLVLRDAQGLGVDPGVGAERVRLPPRQTRGWGGHDAMVARKRTLAGNYQKELISYLLLYIKLNKQKIFLDLKCCKETLTET